MGPEASPGSGSAGRRPKGSLTRQGSSSGRDRKSTRLNSSHSQISYAVFCLKKKKIPIHLPSRTPSISHSHCFCAPTHLFSTPHYISYTLLQTFTSSDRMPLYTQTTSHNI